MAEFYATLPSNTSTDNTLNKFTVHLPRRIELTGEWEVALVELQYPFSWYNVTERNIDNIIEYRKQKRMFKINLPLLHYKDANHLVYIIKTYVKAHSGEDIVLG